ncbi:hypothetical protein PRIPAC_86143 [Pristionchus pacificus]|uniref:Uncharacterized protein n=1 Tax=Pristionchus pacificus TaxID=54126 RepID=A0A2A6BUM3_PRIPA|nr:hypothetical protein PRIPAC_86143 [Pristionchus pacificus]|eukprot:PDM69568.1 hypothetical protein PRIPAC_44664 [Pristionchus pacificus]
MIVKCLLLVFIVAVASATSLQEPKKDHCEEVTGLPCSRCALGSILVDGFCKDCLPSEWPENDKCVEKCDKQPNKFYNPKTQNCMSCSRAQLKVERDCAREFNGHFFSSL